MIYMVYADSVSRMTSGVLVLIGLGATRSSENSMSHDLIRQQPERPIPVVDDLVQIHFSLFSPFETLGKLLYSF